MKIPFHPPSNILEHFIVQHGFYILVL
jgi:hypothetical protein